MADPWLRPGLAMVFDMDGVIVHSNPLHIQAWILYNRRHGIESDGSLAGRMYGKRNDELVPEFFGPGVSLEEIAAHGAAKETLYRELLAPIFGESLVPGISEFVRRHAGQPLGIATNAEPANVDFILDRGNLRRYFQVVVDGHQVSRPKPHPEIYLLAARLLGIEPRNCIVFEDSYSGVAAARAAGTRTVALRTTHRDFPDVHLAIDNFLSPALEPWLRSQLPEGS